MWHIFKKDCLLLLGLDRALTALQGVFPVARFNAGPPPSVGIAGIVPVALLILLRDRDRDRAGRASGSDSGNIVRTRWCVRIARRDLFLAKLLFVVLLVQGPWFVTDLLQGLANGFPLGRAAAAGACRVLGAADDVPCRCWRSPRSRPRRGDGRRCPRCPGAADTSRRFIGATAPTALTGFAWVPTLVRQALLLGRAQVS